MAVQPLYYELTEHARVDLGRGDGTAVPSTWFFIVPADGRLIASASMGNNVAFCELDPASLADGTATWPATEFAERLDAGTFDTEYVATLDTGSLAISDHWHVFDGTYHWVACTLLDGTIPRGVGVAKLTADGTREWAHVVYDAGAGPGLITTQDLWCVLRSGGGLAIGIGKSGSWGVEPDLVVLLIDAAGEPEAHVTGFGDGVVPLSRTGSATYVPSKPDYPYQLLIPALPSVCSQNPIYLVQVNDEWTRLSLGTMLGAISRTPGNDGYGFGMPTQVTLTNGHHAIAVRRINLDDVAEQPDCVKDAVADDCSPIVLLLYDSDNNLMRSEYLITDRGTRPHISAVANTLYVCYDTADTASGVGFSCHVVVLDWSNDPWSRVDVDWHGAPVEPKPAMLLRPNSAEQVYSHGWAEELVQPTIEATGGTTTLSLLNARPLRRILGRADPQLSHPDYADWLLTPSRLLPAARG